ncbi:MAG: tetratricopeptide repeat protein [Candidatus Thiodiazotropha sp. L084R]
MEKEILQTLNEIRGILFALTSLVSVVLLVWVVHWVSSIYANFKKAWENSFINTAEKYFEKAEFEKLVIYCEERLTNFPNHSNAIWWLARAKQEIGQITEAKALFDRLLELEPGWKETHIEPYIKKLAND